MKVVVYVVMKVVVNVVVAEFKKWVGGGCTQIIMSSGPFLSYEIEIGDGPGPKLNN